MLRNGFVYFFRDNPHETIVKNFLMEINSPGLAVVVGGGGMAEQRADLPDLSNPHLIYNYFCKVRTKKRPLKLPDIKQLIPISVV